MTSRLTPARVLSVAPRLALEVPDESMNRVFPFGGTVICVPVPACPHKIAAGDRVIVHTRRNGKLKVLCREVVGRGSDFYLVPRSNDPRFREELRWHPRAVLRWGVPAVGEEEDLSDGPRIVAVVVGYYL